MTDWITDLWGLEITEAVGGTLYSHEIYTYKCRECGECHVTKEGAAEICTETMEE